MVETPKTRARRKQPKVGVALQIELASAAYRLRRKLGTELYRVPASLSKWGDEQEALETSWADLFFDLIYVGVVFRLGDMLVEELTLATTPTSPLVGRGIAWFAVMYLFLMDAWLAKNTFHMRFDVGDMYHKLVDLVESLLVAVLAAHVTTVERFIAPEGYNFLAAATVLKLLLLLLQNLLWAEVALGSDEPPAVLMARRILRTNVVCVLPLGGALATSSMRMDWRITLGLIGAHLALSRLITVFKIVFTNRINETNSTPVHIEYMMRRFGEWTMLMAGEGVFQIVITPIKEEAVWEHLGTFAASFLTLAFLMLVHYTMMPSEAADHAARKSRPRGILHVQVTTVYNMAIVAAGVALKVNLKSIKKDPAEFVVFTWVLCGSLALTLTLMVVARLLHVGPVEVFRNTPPSVRKARAIFWLLRLALPAVFLLIPGRELSSLGNAFATLAIMLLLVLVNFSDLRQADDYDGADTWVTAEQLQQDYEALESEAGVQRRSTALPAPGEAPGDLFPGI